MRRYKALAVGFALLAAVLGPGAGSAAAAQPGDAVITTEFECTPNGGGVAPTDVGPTTTQSVVSQSPSDPASDWLGCEFELVAAPVTVKTSKARGAGLISNRPTVEFGGACSFGAETFAHRIYVLDNAGGTATLFCWGGSQVNT